MEEIKQPPVHNEEKKTPWYFKKGSFVGAFLLVGPLMLPLVWFHPTMTKSRKALWTVIISILTYFLIVLAMDSLNKIGSYYGQISSMMP